MTMSHFLRFSKICAETARMKASQRMYQPAVWPTSQIAATVSVTDFISEISTTALDILICYSRLHIANADVNFDFKGIMIRFSLEEERRLTVANVDMNFDFKGVMIKFLLEEERRLTAETDFLR